MSVVSLSLSLSISSCLLNFYVLPSWRESQHGVRSLFLNPLSTKLGHCDLLSVWLQVSHSMSPVLFAHRQHPCCGFWIAQNQWSLPSKCSMTFWKKKWDRDDLIQCLFTCVLVWPTCSVTKHVPLELLDVVHLWAQGHSYWVYFVSHSPWIWSQSQCCSVPHRSVSAKWKKKKKKRNPRGIQLQL